MRARNERGLSRATAAAAAPKVALVRQLLSRLYSCRAAPEVPGAVGSDAEADALVDAATWMIPIPAERQVIPILF